MIVKAMVTSRLSRPESEYFRTHRNLAAQKRRRPRKAAADGKQCTLVFRTVGLSMSIPDRRVRFRVISGLSWYFWFFDTGRRSV